jgi:hemolysin activation/secretion protein
MRKPSLSVPSTLVILVFGLSANAAMAQSSAPDTPGAVDTPPRLEQRQEQPPASPASPTPPRPAAPMPDSTQISTIQVERFEFQGNTHFSDEALRHHLRLFAGRRLSLYNLFEAADAVTELYQREGWTLASAVVPAQRVDSGTVVLEIVEGSIGRVEIEGLHRYRPALLEARIDARAGDTLRTDTLEADMLRIKRLPGLDARAVLRPGSEYGSTDVVLRVQETAASAMLFTDNYGRENVGEIRGGFSGTLNNPLRLGDEFQVLAMQSQGALLRYGSVGYSLPIHRSNLRAFASYAEARFEVGSGPFAGFIDGKNKVLRAGLEMPLWQDTRGGVDGYLAVKDVSADTDQFGLSTRGTDITLLETGATYTRSLPNGARSRVALNLSSNFRKQSEAALLAGSEPGKHQRFRMGVDAQHRQPLGGFALTGRLSGVLSPDRLVDTELFYIGGPDSVRGYPSAEARGDYGVVGALVLSHAFRVGPTVLDPRIFIDGGRVWRQGDVPGEDAVSLSSAGVGLDVYLMRRANLRVDLARPLDSDRDQISDGRDSGRVFAALQIQF